MSLAAGSIIGAYERGSALDLAGRSSSSTPRLPPRPTAARSAAGGAGRGRQAGMGRAATGAAPRLTRPKPGSLDALEALRLNVASNRRELIREVAPTDRTGVLYGVGAALTDDTRSYAYDFKRMTSQLFVVEGAR